MDDVFCIYGPYEGESGEYYTHPIEVPREQKGYEGVPECKERFSAMVESGEITEPGMYVIVDGPTVQIVNVVEKPVEVTKTVMKLTVE